MNHATTTIADAQREMRFAYYGGAPGMLTSAAVWLTAAIVCLRYSAQQAVWTLLIGGMFIHPLSLLLTKALGRPGKHSRGNPFGTLALASTFWLILSCPLAYAASRLQIEWFFPAMLAVIGGRYLTFATMFGDRSYWICGAVLAIAGYWLARAYAPPPFGAFAGAIIESVFAVVIFIAARREAMASIQPATGQ